MKEFEIEVEHLPNETYYRLSVDGWPTILLSYEEKVGLAKILEETK